MLREAEKNCAERSIDNVRFLESDDQLSGIAGSFDVIRTLFSSFLISRRRVDE